MNLLQAHLPQILLLYSLAFFVMAAAVYLHPRNDKLLAFSPELWLLGVFGVVHGVREGIEWWLGAEIPGGHETWLTASLLWLSYLALFLFAWRLMRRLNPARWAAWGPGAVMAWLAVMALLGPPLLVALTGGGLFAWAAGARYFIGLPATVLAGYALWGHAAQASAQAEPYMARWLRVLSVALLCYSAFAGLVVRGFAQLPAALPTTQSFADATGVPIYLLRMGCVLVAALSLMEMLRYSHARARAQASRLTASLEQANKTLETRVAERTRELEESNRRLQQEVAQRGQAETSLRESEERYRTIIETTQDGIWQIDAEALTTFVNGRMAAMLGYTVDEMLGQPLFQFMDQSGQEITTSNLERRRQGIAEEHDFTFLRKDGRKLHARLRTHPLFDASGRYAGAFALVSDITAQREAAEALHQKELRYQSVVASLAEGVVIQGIDDRIFDCNPAAEHILGLTRVQLLGLTSMDPRWRALREDGSDLRGEDHPSMVTLRTGQPQRDVLMNVHRPDGTRVWINVNSEPMLDPQTGKMVGVVASFTDITQRRQAERELATSEYRWRAVFGQTYQFIGLLDARGHVLEANQTALDFAGLNEADVLGKLFWETPWWTHDAAQQQRLRDAIERAANGEVVRFETTHRAADSRLHYVDFSLKPAHDEQGTLLWLVAEGRDVTERHQHEEDLLEIARGVSAQTGQRFFESLVQHLASVLRADVAFVAELEAGGVERVRTLAVYADGGFVPNFSYSLIGTPCEQVVGRAPCAFPSGVQASFPDDRMLIDMGMHAYVGTPLFTTDGGALGLIAVLYRAPLERADRVMTLLQIFAARAAAEVERRHGELRMRQLSSAIEQTADSIVITNREGVIEYANPAFEETTGYSVREALGRTPAMVKSGAHDAMYYRHLWQTIFDGQVFRDVVINRRKNGEIYYEEKTISPLRNAAGEISHFISTGKDVTERMRTQARLEYLAQHDALTDLPNRVLYLDRLGQAISGAQRRNRQVAVLFLDLDRFKYINDTFGHDVGDKFLQQIALRLRQCVRSGDSVARFGGDEFAVLLEDLAQAADVTPVAEKIVETLAAPFVIEDREFFATTSMGISLYPADGQEAQTLLKHADAAMYRAKDLGRNNFQFYSADLSARALERLTVETRLRQALERGEFFLHYQPQVEMKSQRLLGVEALLRWRDMDLGMVSPAQFIPVAEETGLIMPIGAWVLQSVCEQAAAWYRAGLDFGRVSINLSGRQFADPQLILRIGEALTRTGLPPEKLELEITEGVVMQNPEAAASALRVLHESGVRIAVDDFGIGYSSLSYLKRFAIDTLKIDQSFVRDIASDPNDASIVQAIIAMGHSMGLEVIAEGVETEEQLTFLGLHRCDAVQGYLFSRPLALEDVEAVIRHGHLSIPAAR